MRLVFTMLLQVARNSGEEHYGLGFRSTHYRGDRFVWHSGGLVGWSAMMTLVPDFGLGIAVLTNLGPPNGVTEILTRYIVDRLRGRDPVDWHERHRKWRQQFLAQAQSTKEARAKARHMAHARRMTLRRTPATMRMPPMP
jgi:CubicO group peptidase (beta-lactamase class C family)